jgi:hypothetical protein
MNVINKIKLTDHIISIAEFYVDVVSIQTHNKVGKPPLRMIKSDGWAPYIPQTMSTLTQKE